MEQVRILVVEDEVIVARNIASQLHQLGYIVVGRASSGKDAIAKALATTPELVLMDIILKGEIDGITAASCIREQLDIPVIFLTAYGDEKTLERAKLTQPFGYVVKPFTIKDLRIAIEIGLSQHKLELDLREQRDQLATILDSINDAVIGTNELGVVTFINPSAEHLTGWERREALGTHASQVLHVIDETTEAIIENPVAQVLREQKVVDLGGCISLITKDGKKVPIGDSAAPIRRKPHDISGVVVVFWDLRERRRREYIEQALLKEQELNRLKSLFISTVSHEFRNPLTVIQTAVELLEIQRNNVTQAKRETYLRRIYTAIQSMEKLMEDILFMGRSEAGRLTYNPRLINLERFCQELVEEFSTVTGVAHEIVFSCHSHQTEALMDEQLLYHLFRNLLANAIKYSPEGGQIKFELTCMSGLKLATFQIQDQGIGIPELEQSQIFESFYRASNVKTIQGNGLGLVIVKRCVDAHHGKISVTSQVGHGTTFTVMLPLNSASLVD
jgi:PAS domain S-box-containing protein